MSQQFVIIYCQSYKFARGLYVFHKKELILDTPQVSKVENMQKEELYDLMWSLVFTKFVTEKTKLSLKNFLPSDYPTTENL